MDIVEHSHYLDIYIFSLHFDLIFRMIFVGKSSEKVASVIMYSFNLNVCVHNVLIFMKVANISGLAQMHGTNKQTHTHTNY